MIYTLRALLKRLGLYEWIAFATGFVLMAFELAASRILAPTIGTSIYVWTSVIGVMIAALAAGYAAGGWVADRRGVRQDIAWLLLLASIGVAATCLFYDIVLMNATAISHDPRIQGVFASTALFAPASFTMGMISPYLAKLRVRSLETTGRSVAGLSALNSLGGITGTFSAGFIFFNYVGSRETLALLAGLLLVCSWLVSSTHRVQQRALLSLLICGTMALQFIGTAQAGVVATIDTPTSHYKIVDLPQTFGTLRVLIMGPGGYQSGTHTTGQKELAFDYTRKIAAIVQAAPHQNRVLVLGGGAFTLPEYFGRHYPQAQIDVVEIDPQLPDIAKRYFRYEPTTNINVIAEDGRAYLRETHAQYDIVVVDAYNDAAVPFSLATQEYAHMLARILTPQGIAVANLIAGASRQCMPLLGAIHNSYRSAFSHSLMYPLADLGMTTQQNIIALYSNSPLTWAADISDSSKITIPVTPTLTDNFAPTERLVQQCNG
jgi:predicted membrane-bound spermidine synthase